jgi:sec-independent protein translocase protein TatA
MAVIYFLLINMTFLFLGDIGGGEIMLIMLVILLFFGSKNIPQLARGLGKGIREFKDAASGIQREIEKTMYENPEREYTPKPKTIEAEIEAAKLPEENATDLENKSELPKIEPVVGNVARED